MTAGHAKAHPEVDVRINEAEVCRSMGLYDESLTIYEQILAGLPESDGELVETVKTKIADIRSEIAAREQTEVKRVSAKDISMLKKTLSSQDAGQDGPSGQTLLDSAASFKELGLFSEAIN
jgi:cob(I)alamin adenosyltransferase